MNESRGLVFDVQRFSIDDGPGIRTLIFMKGCPLNCLWCCNPESQSPKQEIMVTSSKCIGCGRCVKVCPTGAAAEKDLLTARKMCIVCGKCVDACPSTSRQMVGHFMSVDKLMEEIEKDIPYYRLSGGGITVSGGEPLMQWDFTVELLKRCQMEGIHSSLETSGYTNWRIFERMLKYVDLVLYDIKHIDSNQHKKLTGVENRLILQNAKKATEIGKKMIIRVPIVPGYNDSEENLRAIAEFTRSLKRVEEIHLLPYHRLGESKYERLGRCYEIKDIVKTLDRNVLFQVRGLFESYNLKVQVIY